MRAHWCMIDVIEAQERRGRPRSAGCRLGLALALFATVAAPARARGDDPYEVPEESRVAVRVLLDLRVARGTRAPSWQEGGPGSLRYGGLREDSGNFSR